MTVAIYSASSVLSGWLASYWVVTEEGKACGAAGSGGLKCVAAATAVYGLGPEATATASLDAPDLLVYVNKGGIVPARGNSHCAGLGARLEITVLFPVVTIQSHFFGTVTSPALIFGFWGLFSL